MWELVAEVHLAERQLPGKVEPEVVQAPLVALLCERLMPRCWEQAKR